MERALISVPQLQIICYGVVGKKWLLAQAAEKNKHCCHTLWVMFCCSFFVCVCWLKSYRGKGREYQTAS